MYYIKSGLLWIVGGLTLLVIGGTLWLYTASSTQAQCGSQSSSCKSCHEVQRQASVITDGTDWHESHAMGDFCYLCHGGNSQASDQDDAHEGMVPPLSDIHASCEQCHADDLEERAQVYADQLGIALTSDGTSADGQTSSTGTATSATTNTTSSTGTSLLSRRISADDPNVIDYRKRYDEIVLGKRDTNWGNIALIIIIELLIVGGTGFVVMNELRRRRMSTVDPQYPEDVVEMLPALSGLKAQTRRALAKLLSNPQIDKVLNLIDSVISNDKGGDK